MYIFGINILADKLHALDARHQGRWVRLTTIPFDWHGSKGTPRALHTYRAQRREDAKAMRREAKRRAA